MLSAARKAMVRDAVLVAAIAVVTVLTLRRWLGDRYLVPTGSMEPLLHGDPEHGDVVFVDKRADRRQLGVGGLVVVRHPTEPGQQLVKRIAASGDDELCCIDIRDGDLWLGPDPQRMAIVAKDPLAARHRQVPWAASDGPAAQQNRLDLRAARIDANGITLPSAGRPDTVRASFRPAANVARHAQPAGVPGHHVGTARPVDAGFLDRRGAVRDLGSEHLVHDCSMNVRLAALAGDVLATVDRRAASFTFHWRPQDGTVTLWCDGVDLTQARLPVVERPQEIEFGYLDGRLYLCIDGKPESLFVYRPEPVEPRPNEPRIRAGRTQLWLAVADPDDGTSSTLVATRLAIAHDLFHWRQPIAGLPGQPGSWPRRVPAGHWFLLGDSAFDSRDSRHFGEVPMASFLGVPCCVLGPWPCTRWIHP
jgi:hypothetical protein